MTVRPIRRLLDSGKPPANGIATGFEALDNDPIALGGRLLAIGKMMDSDHADSVSPARSPFNPRKNRNRTSALIAALLQFDLRL